MAAIEAEGLRRTYKTHTGTVRRKAKEIEAVRGIDFAVREGELFGLLGPNGAGKRDRRSFPPRPARITPSPPE